MRELTSHRVNGLNEAIDIHVMDEPGQGGACHEYYLSVGREPFVGPGCSPVVSQSIKFQNGPIKEFGVNGISQEALLAVVEDRLVSFQAGPFACRENAIALTRVQDAMHWLMHRTRQRMARNVEGTSTK